MKTSRRHLLQYAASTLVLSQLGGRRFFTQGEFEDRAQAQTATPHRFLHIFLRGGWDSTLGTDPMIGDKAQSGAYEAGYKREAVTPISGKDRLVIGSGLAPAAAAFAQIPTAFINGLYVDVTAHPLAENYALSARMSLSRSREYPALAALMGGASGVFPAHLVLGGRIPLGDTVTSNPPLASNDMAGMRGMMSEPGSSQAWGPAQQSFLRQVLQDFNARRPDQTVWNGLQKRLDPIYDQHLDQGLADDPARNDRYGVVKPRDNAAMLVGAYDLLKSGLSPYVTVLLSGFDTHTQEFALQKPLQMAFAAALKALVEDLRQTPDPAQPKLSLADTTTILVGSEFVRTPSFNAADGTDHWKSASAIVMGKGVRDNTVLGQTDAMAQALGWEQGKPVPRTDLNALTHEAIAGALLLRMGFSDAQSTLGKEAVFGLFI